MRDTVHSLSHALAHAHPMLGDSVVWRRIIEHAADGSNTHLAALVGTVFCDEAVALVSSLRLGREHGLRRCHRETSTGRESSPSLADFRVGGQANAQGMAVWGGEDVVLGVDEVAHSSTMRPAAINREERV
ncbi:MAG TPA: hypothetical protein VLT45_16795 [Kofleriaceae bacterium]|nr:hypothetical protein [Kofleriaceae bacterium]